MAAWESTEIEAIEELMAERTEGLLRPGERLAVSGRTEPGEVFARFSLEGMPAGERFELESKVARAQVPDPDRARDLAIDALDLLLLEYLEAERGLRYSGVWEQRELQGLPVSVRVERTNPQLDAQADELLKNP
jgi:hypothetical protein